MKALLHTKPFHFEYTEVPEPEIGPEDVLVRVKACGICGSDVHGYTGTTGRRIPPLIMGHEASGVVDRIGERVSQLKPGDRVCLDSTVFCNACEACRAGRFNRCQERRVLGVSVPGNRCDGAFADLIGVPWWIAAPIPDELTFEQAALLEPVSIAVHAVNRSPILEGQKVVIVGAGTIGLFVLQAALLRKPEQVVVTDLDEERLALARRFGATHTIAAQREDAKAAILQATGGLGADVSFEVVGFGSTLRQALAVTRMGGSVVLLGNLEKNVELEVPDVISRELTLIGSYASSGEYRDCINLVASGRIRVDPLISEVLPLCEGPAAFDRLHKGRENLLKLILRP